MIPPAQASPGKAGQLLQPCKPANVRTYLCMTRTCRLNSSFDLTEQIDIGHRYDDLHRLQTPVAVRLSGFGQPVTGGGSDKAISQHSQHCLIRFCKPPKTKRTFHGGHGRHKRHKRHKRGPIKAERGAE